MVLTARRSSYHLDILNQMLILTHIRGKSVQVIRWYGWLRKAEIFKHLRRYMQQRPWILDFGSMSGLPYFSIYLPAMKIMLQPIVIIGYDISVALLQFILTVQTLYRVARLSFNTESIPTRFLSKKVSPDGKLYFSATSIVHISIQSAIEFSVTVNGNDFGSVIVDYDWIWDI